MATTKSIDALISIIQQSGRAKKPDVAVAYTLGYLSTFIPQDVVDRAIVHIATNPKN